MFDLAIIGAGPAGLSAADAARSAGLSYIVLEKGLIADTIFRYPVGRTVFSTTNELEFEPGSLKPCGEKPTREELLSYYVRFALERNLNIHTEEEVLSVAHHAANENADDFYYTLTTDKGDYEAARVLFTIGGMAYPRHLNVAGEDLPKVQHRFVEPYPYVRKNAVVVGGGNSAGEAALFLAEEGANAMLATFRADWESTDPKQGCIKHWVRQPLAQKLEQKCLQVFFLGRVIEIREREIVLEEETGATHVFPNDVVFVLIGADADLTLLTSLGVETVKSKHGTLPVYDAETFETNVRGVYVAGHFTNERHIKEAIAVPRRIIPRLAATLLARA